MFNLSLLFTPVLALLLVASSVSAECVNYKTANGGGLIISELTLPSNQTISVWDSPQSATERSIIAATNYRTEPNAKVIKIGKNYGQKVGPGEFTKGVPVDKSTDTEICVTSP